MTLMWLGAAVGSKQMARRAMKRGLGAMGRQDFVAAHRHLKRAARHDALRREAMDLSAEAAICAGRPADALHAINTFLLDNGQTAEMAMEMRSTRVRLLRGIAGCMLGRAVAARRELAAIPREEATADELLAAAQACVMAGDAAGARQLCGELEGGGIAGAIGGRVRLCRSAIFFQAGRWAEALAALPREEQCTPADGIVCRRIREELGEKIAAVDAVR
jgi:hypothetical protein